MASVASRKDGPEGSKGAGRQLVMSRKELVVRSRISLCCFQSGDLNRRVAARQLMVPCVSGGMREEGQLLKHAAAACGAAGCSANALAHVQQQQPCRVRQASRHLLMSRGRLVLKGFGGLRTAMGGCSSSCTCNGNPATWFLSMQTRAVRNAVHVWSVVWLYCASICVFMCLCLVQSDRANAVIGGSAPLVAMQLVGMQVPGLGQRCL